MGHANKFLLLLWKNYLIQRRKIFTTILEIALPTFFGLILVLIRLRVTGQQVPNGQNWSACSDIFEMPNSSFPKKLAFTPDIPLTQSLMAKVKDSMGYFTGKQFFTFTHCRKFLCNVIKYMKCKEKENMKSDFFRHEIH